MISLYIYPPSIYLFRSLSETWLNDSFSDYFHIPGYNFIAKSRKHRIGGGVDIFIKSSFRGAGSNLGQGGAASQKRAICFTDKQAKKA
jgi:hypothetical protein